MIDTVLNAVESLLRWVIGFLPFSPFQTVLSGLENMPNLGWLNWFIPINDFIQIGTYWLGAITIYYFYSVIMRWAKIIDG